MFAALQKVSEVRCAALWVLLWSAVLACSEDKTILTAPGAGSGGSGGVSGGAGSGGAGSGGAGSGGAAGASGSTAERDASTDASTDASDASSLCCEPSPEPECCMVYGGRRSTSESCGVICDGIPLPNAGWQLGTDSYGCPVWIEPPRTNDCCGCAPPDSGL